MSTNTKSNCPPCATCSGWPVSAIVTAVVLGIVILLLIIALVVNIKRCSVATVEGFTKLASLANLTKLGNTTVTLG